MLIFRFLLAIAISRKNSHGCFFEYFERKPWLNTNFNALFHYSKTSLSKICCQPNEISSVGTRDPRTKTDWSGTEPKTGPNQDQQNFENLGPNQNQKNFENLGPISTGRSRTLWSVDPWLGFIIVIFDNFPE